MVEWFRTCNLDEFDHINWLIKLSLITSPTLLLMFVSGKMENHISMSHRKNKMKCKFCSKMLRGNVWNIHNIHNICKVSSICNICNICNICKICTICNICNICNICSICNICNICNNCNICIICNILTSVAFVTSYF